MPLFYYRSINAQGKKKAGVIEAETQTAARDLLRAQKVAIYSLEEKPQRSLCIFRRKERITRSHILVFTSQLAHLLMAGLPLYESLLSLEEQYRGESFHPLILSLSEQIKKGSLLSEAMRRFPATFDGLYCAMVAAGESVGALDRTLDKLANLLTKQNKLKKQLLTALLYPALLFVFSIGVCLLLLIFVIPSVETLFDGRSVNCLTSCVIGLSHLLRFQWPLYLPALLLLFSGLGYFFRSTKGKLRFQRMLLSLPFLKTFILQSAIARFTRTMGSLLQGGVPIISALQIARGVMHLPEIEKVLEQAEAKIIEGSLLSKELKKSPLFPPLVARMLAIGEEGGNAAVMLHKLADLYEEDVEKMATRLTTLAQPVILVIMGGLVGLIMLAVLVPLTDANAFL